METERASPSTRVSHLQGRAGASLPSTSANSAATASALTARAMARWVAWRILTRSISPTLASPTPTATAISMMRGNSASRVCASSCLESFSPLGMRVRPRITAAATTGPAKGPRPASSTPHTGPAMVFR